MLQLTMRTNKNQLFYKRTGTFPLLILFIALLFSSCVTQHDLEYLRVQNKNEEYFKSFDEANIPEYKLKPMDELNIDINSLDDPTTNVFKQVERNSGYTVTPYSASLSSYLIDQSGHIQLPFIGDILVENKTIPQVKAIIQDSLNHILSSPTVNVKLVNRYITIFGEVKNPGHFAYAQEKMTIYDALSLAGDISIYGDRKNLVLSRNENGKNVRIVVDLTSSKIMASDNYYIRPNDMLYVKPMRKRFWGLYQFPWNTLLASISTGVLIYSVFVK